MPFDPLQLDGYSLTLLKEPETSRKVAKSTKQFKVRDLFLVEITFQDQESHR
jgi:hypothetical protein